eukprot:COSAG03_NODE_56_length_15957_cov_538.173225_3_plen_414_part_00
MLFLESGNESTTGNAYCQVAYDLAAAWQVCSRETARQYANKLEWRDPAHPAHWLHVTQGSLANLAHMPARAQKALSKAVNKRIAKGSRARIRMDQSTGAARRSVRAAETTVQQAGYAISAHPWQSSQTLSLASHEVLVATCWRYCLDVTAGLQPSQTCPHPCKHCGPGRPALLDTPERVEIALEAKREWVEHAVRSCVRQNGVRRLCHDAVLRAIADMLISAGFEDVQIEDRWWDEADGEDRETRRPDITAFNPRDRKRYVIDVVGAWSEVTSLDKAWARDGVMADVKAKAKWRSYDASLASQDTTGRGWLCGGKSKSTDVFVPFAFEIGGALGTEAEAFMREAVKVAEFCRKGQGDLQHWSAMSWWGHWRQRIGVEIVRGLARIVERAATGGQTGGHVGGPASSLEWSQDCV